MSILVDYYRFPPSERKKVTHDERIWREFEPHLIKAQSNSYGD